MTLFPLLLGLGCTITGAILSVIRVRQATGLPEASGITALISEGMSAYFKRAMASVAQLIGYMVVLLLILTMWFHKSFHWTQMGAFILGGVVMGGGSWVGLQVAPRFISLIVDRCKGHIHDVVPILLDASFAIMMMTMGAVMTGLWVCQMLAGSLSLVGYGVGIIFSTFFLRIGGGIFKTAADMGSEISTTHDPGLPHFDPRNPATLLDISADYIGKMVGFGSDLVSSFVVAILALQLFTIYFVHRFHTDHVQAQGLIHLPILVAAWSLLFSVFGYLFSRWRAKRSSQNFLLEGLYLSVIGVASVTWWLSTKVGIGNAPIIAYLVGLLGGIFVAIIAEFTSSNRFLAARRIAQDAEYGSILTIFHAYSVGFRSSGLFFVILLVVVMAAYWISNFYGIGMAALGMVSTMPAVFLVTMFSPLASHTNKMIGLTQLGSVYKRNGLEMIRIAGTAESLGNGFSAATSVISSTSLFFSLCLVADLGAQTLSGELFWLLVGMVIGVCLPVVILGFLLRGLIRVVRLVVEEVRYQFHHIPYLIEGKALPDMAHVSDRTARFSLNALTWPGALMVLPLVLIGFMFNVYAVIGIVLGTLLAGVLNSFLWANVGDGLSNAKRYIENGHLGGKSSPTYKFASTADLMGDGLKDLMSPAMNILTKSFAVLGLLVVLLVG